jgi:hypothetical protein
MPLPLLAMGGLMAAKGLSGFFGARGKDKAAKAEATNANRMNRWKHKKESAKWSGERGWQHKKRGRSHAFRQQLLAAIMGNSKYGLSKLFPGFAQLKKQYTPEAVVNPYEVAGAPPKLEAVQGGLGAGAAAAIGGAADVAGKMLPYTSFGGGGGEGA